MDILNDLKELRAASNGSPADLARIDGLVEKYRKLADAKKDDIDKVIEAQEAATKVTPPLTTSQTGSVKPLLGKDLKP